MTTPLRVALIGLGVISKFYLAALNKLEHLTLAAVCDINEPKLASFRDAGLPCFTDYQTLLDRPDIDAVIINVPNDVHFPICRNALFAGKNVCCEKPLTLRFEEAQNLVALSYATGRTLFTAFHRRYNVNFQKALEQLPPLKDIASIVVRYKENIQDHAGDDRWYLEPERCGGGCIADNGPNVYDMLTHVLGYLHIASTNIEWNEHGIDVKAHVHLTNVHQIPVEVELDWDYHQGEQKDIRVILANGQQIYADLLEGFPLFKGSLFHEYEAILAHFAHHVAANKGSGRYGLDAVRLVQETYQAHALLNTGS